MTCRISWQTRCNPCQTVVSVTRSTSTFFIFHSSSHGIERTFTRSASALGRWLARRPILLHVRHRVNNLIHDLSIHFPGLLEHDVHGALVKFVKPERSTRGVDVQPLLVQ